MKRILSLFVVLVLSYAAIVIGIARESQTIKIVGMVFGAAVLLAIVLEIIKLVGLFISKSLSSMLFVATGLGIVGLLAWQGQITGIVAFTSTIILSIALSFLVIRKLAEWSYSSLIIGEIFSLVSSYRIHSYIGNHGLVSKEDIANQNADYNNLIVLLRQNLKFNAKEAKEAATYACKQLPSASLENKLKEALVFIDMPREKLDELRDRDEKQN